MATHDARSWTTLREQIFAKLRRPYRSEADMNEVGHGIVMKWCHLFVRHQGKIAVKFEILWIKKLWKLSLNALFVAILKKLYFNFPATVELELNGLRFFGKFVVLEKKFVNIVKFRITISLSKNVSLYFYDTMAGTWKIS
jgi:hypothetical protein